VLDEAARLASKPSDDQDASLTRVFSLRPKEIGQLLSSPEGDEDSKRWLAGRWVEHANVEADKIYFAFSHDWKHLLQRRPDSLREGRRLEVHIETVRHLSRAVVERPDLFEKIPALPSLLKKSMARLQVVSRGFGALEPALKARGAILMNRVQHSLVEAALAVEALVELKSPEPGLRPDNLAWHVPTSELAHLWEGTRRVYDSLLAKLRGAPAPSRRKPRLNERLVALAGIASIFSAVVAAAREHYGLAFALLGAVVLSFWGNQKLGKRNDRLDALRKEKESQPWHNGVENEIVVELEQSLAEERPVPKARIAEPVETDEDPSTETVKAMRR
jgi:hypothetical protein